MELKEITKKLTELKDYAIELGAKKAMIIETSKLVPFVKESARARCYIPTCKWYGSSILCPPHNPLYPEITKKICQEHKYAILFQMDVPPDHFAGEDWIKKHRPEENKHNEMVSRIEGKAFHMGFHLAMGFSGGECNFCLPDGKCVVLRGESCLHYLKTHPAMEACGFDVFAIAEEVGWEMVTIGWESDPKHIPCASMIGLVIVV